MVSFLLLFLFLAKCLNLLGGSPNICLQLIITCWHSSPEERTMHSIDTVQRIIEYFLMHEHQKKTEDLDVSKLLDNYLAEIATDPNLSISKFQVLAEALPANTRVCHNGLYRAIDTYLKVSIAATASTPTSTLILILRSLLTQSLHQTHPSLPEQERRRLCRIMNCQRLSLDACMHVAQNDRLPLKIVIQVLLLALETVGPSHFTVRKLTYATHKLALIFQVMVNIYLASSLTKMVLETRCYFSEIKERGIHTKSLHETNP